MHLLKLRREVLAPNHLTLKKQLTYIAAVWMFVGSIVMLLGYASYRVVRGPQVSCGLAAPLDCVLSLMLPDSSEAVITVEEEIAPRVIITAASISEVTCADVMEKFEKLPAEELLDQPGLLDQVGDCTLEALDEPGCSLSDPLGCVSYVWHAIVH
jgi:hypothetical protein